MRYSIFELGSLALLFTAATALTITSPTPGSNIDPTQAIEVQWTSDSSGPSTVDLWIDHEDPNGATTQQTLASGVNTSKGSFTIPPNTIQNWGRGYLIQVTEADGGDVLAEAKDLTLSPFSNSVSTDSEGRPTLVTQSPTAQGPITAPTSLHSATGVTILSGTVTPELTGTGSVRSTGFITSSVSRSSSEASAAATSASNTNTANGQIQMRGSELVLGAAGVLAGIVALLA